MINSNKLGRVKRLENATDEYIKILKKNFPKTFSLKGIKIAIDCANGAAYKSAPKLLESLGAKVFNTGTNPNGKNINLKCGSTYPNKIKNFTKAGKISLNNSAENAKKLSTFFYRRCFEEVNLFFSFSFSFSFLFFARTCSNNSRKPEKVGPFECED